MLPKDYERVEFATHTIHHVRCKKQIFSHKFSLLVNITNLQFKGLGCSWISCFLRQRRKQGYLKGCS